MNERPSFYPKHLARQYVSSTRCSDTRPKAEVRPLESETETKIGAKKFVFAPAITSSTVYLPSARSQENVVPTTTTTTTTVIRQPQEIEANCDQSKPSSKVLSGLPDSFVEAMRRLFNLMDTKNEGRIKFEGEILYIVSVNFFHVQFYLLNIGSGGNLSSAPSKRGTST